MHPHTVPISWIPLVGLYHLVGIAHCNPPENLQGGAPRQEVGEETLFISLLITPKTYRCITDMSTLTHSSPRYKPT